MLARAGELNATPGKVCQETLGKSPLFMLVCLVIIYTASQKLCLLGVLVWSHHSHDYLQRSQETSQHHSHFTAMP